MSIYKGEDMIAGPTQQKFVRKPAWSRAINIESLQIQTGYTAPADGLIVGTLVPAVANTRPRLRVNGVVVCMGHNSASWASNICVQVPISAGEIAAVDNNAIVNQAGDFSFVPFEDSIIGDPITITPEYIRNLHDPDWSAPIAVSSTQIDAGYTVTKRGIIVGTYTVSSTGDVYIRINGVDVQLVNTQQKSVTIPVCVGDVISTNTASRLTGNFKVVPYKQQ